MMSYLLTFFYSFLNTRYCFIIFFLGATSIHEPSADVGHSTNGDQSIDTTPPIDANQSCVAPTCANPQFQEEPSSENSHNEVDRRPIISVQQITNP